MEKTTIAISKDLKKKIATFGNAGESYSEVLERIYDAAVKTQIRELLLNEEGFISLNDFEKEVEKKWPRSK